MKLTTTNYTPLSDLLKDYEFDPSKMPVVSVYSCPAILSPNDAPIQPSPITIPYDTDDISSAKAAEIQQCIRYNCEVCGEEGYVEYRDEKTYIIPSLCVTCRKKLKKLLALIRLDE